MQIDISACDNELFWVNSNEIVSGQLLGNSK